MSEVKKRSTRRLIGIGAATVAALVAGTWFWQGQATIPGDPTDDDQVAFGGRVYGRICAHCHGAGLDGQLGWQQPMKDGTRLAPAHNADGETWHHSDQTLFQVVKFGGETLKPAAGTSRMPAFEKKLTDGEIWSVIAFIKSNWPTDLQEAQRNAAAEKSSTR